MFSVSEVPSRNSTSKSFLLFLLICIDGFIQSVCCLVLCKAEKLVVLFGGLFLFCFLEVCSYFVSIYGNWKCSRCK